MNTDQFIAHLAKNMEPVRPLRPPWIRAGAWFAMSIPYVALVVVVMSPRSDLIGKMSELRFVFEQGAALATSIAAAATAFATTIPGYSRKVLLLPAIPLAVWLGSLSQRCIQDWMQFGLDGLSLRPDWICLPAIILIGTVPAIAMTFMLRRGVPLMPNASTALGGLAAAGLGDFGLRLFHPVDASLMVLVWQFGCVLGLAALAASVGGYLLNWNSPLGTTRLQMTINMPRST